SIASTKRIPAFTVFTDATLRIMASKKPQNIKEFSEISGVGEVKKDRYGALFIREIKSYLIENKEAKMPVSIR
ncbi:MAG: HRDC domain-containing protein, partial [Acutalibacteraceae bacterium]